MVNYANVKLYSSIVAGNNAYYPVTNPGEDIVGGDSYDSDGHSQNGHNFIGGRDDSAPNFPASTLDTGTPPKLLPNRGGGTYGDLVGTAGTGYVGAGLGTFGYHGGFTETYLPASGSQVIDNGENKGVSVWSGPTLTYDQRDVPYVRTKIQSGVTANNYSDGTDVGATEMQTLPTVSAVYADRAWATGYSLGDTISGDADPVASGTQTATYGINAFASVNDAIKAAAEFFAASPSSGKVVVNGSSGGSTFSEDVYDASAVPVILQYGTISFNSLTMAAGSDVEVTATGGGTTGTGITFNTGGLQSSGLLNIKPGSGTHPTILVNTGTDPLVFGGGSVTNVSALGHGGSNDALLNLHGHNALVTGLATGSPAVPGALFSNDGYVGNSTGSGAIVADGDITTKGALVKGAGTFQYSVITQEGGVFQAGDCPGIDFFSAFTFGPGGVGDFNFVINNATGVSGPTPDASGHVSGWSRVETDDLNWAASGDQPLVLHLQTQADPTTIGDDTGGLMNNFDSHQTYSWEFMHWSGTYTGPTSDAALNDAVRFDTSQFQNACNGSFSLHVDLTAQTISLVYTPNP